MEPTPPKRNSKVVRLGNNHVTVYPWTHPKSGAKRWRFGCKPVGGDWKYRTFKTKGEAETAAENFLKEQAKGEFEWSMLSPSRKRFLQTVNELCSLQEEAPLLSYLAQRKKSGEVTASIPRFLTWKVQATGEETRHLANVRRNLGAFGNAFGGMILSDVADEAVLKWWTARVDGKARKTAKELRGDLCAFWNWAVIDGIAIPGPSPAHKLPNYKLVKMERRVLTVEEMRSLLANVRPEWRAWVILGGFAGLRPEEISPPRKKGMSKQSKYGIRHEDIDWKFKVIRLSEDTSKNPEPRKVPLNDACIAGLRWAGLKEGMTGPICLSNPVEAEETLRLGKVVFKTGWPQDALRHSYGSYRNALITDMPRVAEEMGNSVTMLKRHYHIPKAFEEGEAWFSIRPDVPICSDETQARTA